MPYRDGAPAPSTSTDLTAPARLLGAYGAAQFLGGLAHAAVIHLDLSSRPVTAATTENLFGSVPPNRWMALEAHAIWKWLPVVLSLVGIAASVWTALRARDRARQLAIAAAIVIGIFVVLATANLVGEPDHATIDRTSGYPWPYPHWPILVFVRPMLAVAGVIPAVWSIARPRERVVPWLATTATSAFVFMMFAHAVDRPWVQLGGRWLPIGSVYDFLSVTLFLAAYAPFLWLALAGSLRGRDELGEPPPRVPMELALPPLVAITFPCGLFAVMVGVLAFVDSSFMKQFGLETLGRLEYVPDLVRLVQGSVIAGAIALLLAVHRAKRKGFFALAASTVVAGVATSLVLAMRGMLHLPISPMFGEDILFFGWTANTCALVAFASVLMRDTTTTSLLTADEESANATGDAIKAMRLCLVAAATTGLAIFVVGIAEVSKGDRTTLREIAAVIGFAALCVLLASATRHGAATTRFANLSRSVGANRSPES